MSVVAGTHHITRPVAHVFANLVEKEKVAAGNLEKHRVVACLAVHVRLDGCGERAVDLSAVSLCSFAQVTIGYELQRFPLVLALGFARSVDADVGSAFARTEEEGAEQVTIA